MAITGWGNFRPLSEGDGGWTLGSFASVGAARAAGR